MYKDLLAGCVAGSSGVLVGHPLDTLKTRIQLQSTRQGSLHILGDITRQEGVSWLALYRGMAAPLVAAGLLNALLFASYTTTLRALNPPQGIGRIDSTETEANNNNKKYGMGEIIMASTVGTLFQLVPAIPIELIKTKLQTQSMTGPQHRVHCTGPLDCAIKIIRADGLIGLYRGGAVMFWRDLIGYFFYIPAFELFRSELRVMREKYGGSNGRPVNDGACELLAGGLAGSLSWWLICPFELVKNRLQRSAPNGQNQQRSWRRVVAHLVAQGKSGGGGSGSGINKICGTVGNFYRGGTVLALRAFPVNAVIFFVHSKCSQLF